MTHLKKPLILLFFIVVYGTSLASCQAKPSVATPSAPGISVGITSDTCPNIVVQVGDQVTWTNQDSDEHVVREKPSEGQAQFDSGVLASGDSFSFNFIQTGIYTYECSENGLMTGTVTVQP